MEHDTSNYRLETPHGCVAKLCALCRERIALDPGVYTAAQIDQRIAAHHAVCPKRPIEVGDYVRWEMGWHHDAGVTRDNWAEGEVISVTDGSWSIRVDRDGTGKREVGRAHAFGPGGAHPATIRRIPCPVAAQDIDLRCGDLVRWHPTLESLWGGMCIDGIAERVTERADGARRVTMLRVTAVHRGICTSERGFALGSLVDVTMAPGTVDRLPTCAPGCQCGAHAPSPAPALVDGRDREWCLAKWMENRLAVEGGSAPPNAMTRMQIDVGREMWLERFGRARAGELAGKIAAAARAERNRVRVDLQDID